MIPKFGSVLIESAGHAYYDQPAPFAFQLTNDGTPDQADFAELAKALQSPGDRVYFNLKVDQVGDPPLSGKYKPVHAVTLSGGKEVTDQSVLQRLSELVKRAPLSDYTKERTLDHIQKTIEQNAGLNLKV